MVIEYETDADGWYTWKHDLNPDKYLWGFNDCAYGSGIRAYPSEGKWHFIVDYGDYEISGAIESDKSYDSVEEVKEAALTAYIDMERERYKQLKETLKNIGREL